MYFSQLDDGKGSKVTKMAAVALFHVAVATLLINSMNVRTISTPHVPEEVVLLHTPEVPPPPPPDTPQPMPQLAPPQIVVPPPEIVAAQTPPPDAATATVSADPPAPQQPATPAQPPAVQAQAPASSRSTQVRTAVLADANGCAKPDYPARAARDGVSGTVTLALLVGTDGRVASSRVEHSSGSRDLDKAAIAALSMCKFKPASNGGVLEQAWAQIAYVWTLEQ